MKITLVPLFVAVLLTACDNESLPFAPLPTVSDSLFPIRQAADGRTFAFRTSVFTTVRDEADLVGEFGPTFWVPTGNSGDKARRNQPDANWLTVSASATTLPMNQCLLVNLRVGTTNEWANWGAAVDELRITRPTDTRVAWFQQSSSGSYGLKIKRTANDVIQLGCVPTTTVPTAGFGTLVLEVTNDTPNESNIVVPVVVRAPGCTGTSADTVHLNSTTRRTFSVGLASGTVCNVTVVSVATDYRQKSVSPASATISASLTSTVQIRVERITAANTPCTYVGGGVYCLSANQDTLYLSPAAVDTIINPTSGQVSAFTGTTAFVVGTHNNYTRRDDQKFNRDNSSLPLKWAGVKQVLNSDGIYCLGGSDASGNFLYFGPMVFTNLPAAEHDRWYCRNGDSRAIALTRRGPDLLLGRAP